MYMPEAGRWNGVDGLADQAPHLFSFAAANLLEQRIVTRGKNAYIDFSSIWAGDKINTYLTELDGVASFFTYASNAGADERYDIKTNEDNPGGKEGAYYGSRLPDGTIVSARDAGNILAGVVADRTKWMTNNFALNGFGSLDIGGSKPAGFAVLVGSYIGGMGSGNVLNPLNFHPGHGEDRATFKAIQYGMKNSKKF
ncbi:MAG: hypothetical protein R3D00_14520 [Bacteroidia bacterium]